MRWDLTQIEDYKDKCFRPAGKYEDSDDGYVVKLTTERIIYACEAVEMSGIKPDNVDEFYTRYLMFNRAIQRGGRRLTLADIEDHVGLCTNVSTKSWEQFDARISRIMREDAEMQVNIERGEAQGGE